MAEKMIEMFPDFLDGATDGTGFGHFSPDESSSIFDSKDHLQFNYGTMMPQMTSTQDSQISGYNSMLQPSPINVPQQYSPQYPPRYSPDSISSDSGMDNGLNGTSPTPSNDSFPSLPPSPPNITGLSSTPAVPCSDTYFGEFGFQLGFQPRKGKDSKSPSWTYSDMKNKLYVDRETSCPILFKTAQPPPTGSIIRALPVYMSPEHIKEPVKRCPNHMQKASDLNPCEPNHLVRCEHPKVQYVTDPVSKRQSLIIPHEQPQAGAEWVTNLFQFMCFSSCVGGLERRAIQVVFTLEHGSSVLGRFAVEVRICACPGRDRRSDENPPRTDRYSNGKVKRLQKGLSKINMNAVKKAVDGDLFQLTIRGKDNYETLMSIRDALELAARVPQAIKEEHQGTKAAEDLCPFIGN